MREPRFGWNCAEVTVRVYGAGAKSGGYTGFRRLDQVRGPSRPVTTDRTASARDPEAEFA